MSSEVDLALSGVTKRYGPTVALAGVSFQVRRGSCHGLVGPNGAGKTTTFGLAAGFLRPSEGTVRVLGVEPHARGTHRPRMGVLPQDAQLPPYLDVGPLLTYWARLSGEGRPEQAARIALDRVGLSSAWDAPPQSLSHGVAKRVALAQSLLGEPALLLLDEPTAGLDPRVAAEVRTLLAGLRGSCTVVISSHNLSELERLCDAVTVLDHGRVVQDGSLAEITGRGAEFSLQISRGDVPLAELRALTGVAEATLQSTGTLTVRLSADAPAAEDVIAQVLEQLLARGVRLTSLTQGRSLEQRVLDVTRETPSQSG
jgi:ABC-2 type transport system ATP-binding protein